VAVVYLVPKDRDGRNSMTLCELQEDIIYWRSKGKVVVVGDFNARVGELSNIIHTPDSDISEEGRIFKRSSLDKIVDSQGRKVLECMNAVGMVLVNGLQDKAEWTSYQYGGNAVIDLIWVEADRIGNFRNCKVWNEDAFVIGDHRMISIDGIWEVSAEKSSRGVEKEESVTGWNINDKGNKDYWTKLVESGNILMSEWMNKVIRSDSEEKIDSRQKVEELWSSC